VVGARETAVSPSRFWFDDGLIKIRSAAPTLARKIGGQNHQFIIRNRLTTRDNPEPWFRLCAYSQDFAHGQLHSTSGESSEYYLPELAIFSANSESMTDWEIRLHVKSSPGFTWKCTLRWSKSPKARNLARIANQALHTFFSPYSAGLAEYQKVSPSTGYGRI
jgi:hypothetical protein